jgi:hypothetical protein
VSRIVHPACEPSCSHATVGRTDPIVTIGIIQGSRADLEPGVIEAHPGQAITYLGIRGPDRGDDHWAQHAWRIGGKPWVSMPRVQVPKDPTPDGKAIYRREVWTGSGEPAGPVPYNRPAAPEKEPFPVPLHTSDMSHTLRWPQPVTDIVHAAHVHGWENRITYAQGWVPHATHGTPSARPKQLWAVRLRRGDQRAVAVRADDSWKSFWTWSPRRMMVRTSLLADFKALLGEDW